MCDRALIPNEYYGDEYVRVRVLLVLVPYNITMMVPVLVQVQHLLVPYSYWYSKAFLVRVQNVQSITLKTRAARGASHPSKSKKGSTTN